MLGSDRRGFRALTVEQFGLVLLGEKLGVESVDSRQNEAAPLVMFDRSSVSCLTW